MDAEQINELFEDRIWLRRANNAVQRGRLDEASVVLWSVIFPRMELTITGLRKLRRVLDLSNFESHSETSLRELTIGLDVCVRSVEAVRVPLFFVAHFQASMQNPVPQETWVSDDEKENYTSRRLKELGASGALEWTRRQCISVCVNFEAAWADLQAAFRCADDASWLGKRDALQDLSMAFNSLYTAINELHTSVSIAQVLVKSVGRLKEPLHLVLLYAVVDISRILRVHDAGCELLVLS